MDETKTFLHYFTRQASITPDRVALNDCNNAELTYAKADEHSNIVAESILQKGLEKGDVVAVLLERTVCFPVACIGIFKSGAVYLPIDSIYPQQRIQFMLEDSGAKILITSRKMDSLTAGFGGVKIYIDELTEKSACSKEIPIVIDGEDPSYIIYTSGTSGTPKGALNAHKGITNLIEAYGKALCVTEDDISGVFSNFAFDASLLQTFVFLAKGARVDIMPASVQTDMDELERYIKSHGITITCMPPAIVKLFDESRRKETPLRCILAGGDKLSFKTKGPYALYNAYGPSETSIMTSVFLVDKMYDNIPIGKPFDNIHYCILDENGKQVADGDEGELCIAGLCVGKGYLNRPELTAEKFVGNIYSDDENQAVLYHTGDLCKCLPDGNYVFLGRIDTQINLYGYRIELGEIEAVMRTISGITDAICTNFTDEDGEQYIAGFYTGQKILPTEVIKAILAEKLPRHMIPKVFEKIENIPLSDNGKYDRKALVRPEKTEQADGRAPRTQAEKLLSETIADISGELDRDFDRSFIEAGGDSLLAIRLVAALRKKGCALNAHEILDSEKTLGELADSLKQITIDSQEKSNHKWEHLNNRERQKLCEKYGEENIEDISSLTPTQRGMLVYYLRNPQTTEYIDQVIYKIDGDFTLGLCGNAFSVLSQKHPVLRACIAHEGLDTPKQIILADRAVEVKGIMLNNGESLNKIIERDLARGFDFENDGLLRITVIKDEGNAHYLMLSFAHIILDGWSVGNILTDFTDAYNSLDNGEKQQALEQESRLWFKQNAGFFDFVRTLNSTDMDKASKYFVDMLAGYETDAMIAYDCKPEKHARKHEKKTKKISGEIMNGAARLASKYKLAVSAVFEAVYGLALQKYCYSDDVVFAKTTSGRNYAYDGIDHMVGLFINTLPARVLTERDDTFYDLMHRVQHRVDRDRAYDYTDLSEVLKHIPQREEVLRTLFSYNQFPDIDRQDHPGRFAMSPYKEVQATHYNMAFTVNPGLEASIDVTYNKNAYRADTIDQFLSFYLYLLQQAVTQPDSLIREASLISTERQNALIALCQGPVDDSWKDETYIGLFAKQVSNTPERTAIKDCYGNELTYAQLNAVTNRLALKIGDMSGEKKPIGIMTDRSVLFPIAAIAIFKSGRAYLPINSEYPEENLRYMIEDSDIDLIITCDSLSQAASGFCSKVLNITNWNEYIAKDASFEYQGSIDDLAYIIYTSGTTGKPKGTLLSVKCLVNHCRWSIDYFGENLITAATSGFSFDASVEQIFPKLISGGTVIIVNRETRDDLEALEKLTEREMVSSMHLSTVLAKLFMESYSGHQLKSLSAAGEKLSVDKIPDTYQLHNLYGPTEYTVISTAFLVDRVYDNIPVGKLVHNTYGYILDEHNRMLPHGALGQLCLSGRQMSAGYLNKPELTVKAFVKNPYAVGEGTQILYKTGDLARLLPDGTIEYHGRIDTQIKLRGFRIELSEIEQAVRSHVMVKDVVVILAEPHSNDPYICCYYVSHEALEHQELSDYVAARLPAFMVPQVFAAIEEIPLTPNGKVDKRALPKQERRRVQAYVPPQNETEQKLEEIYCAVLGLERISRETDFFEAGGTSLSVISAVAKLKSFYQVDINMLYENPSIEKLAALLISRESELKTLPQRRISRVGQQAESIKMAEEKKCEYLKSIKGLDELDVTAKSNYKTVLLTGATGYLGVYLLKELLKYEDYDIVVIIRAGSKEEAVSRLLEKTAYYFDEDYLPERVKVFAGDVSHERLGLSADEYGRLAETVDLVINAAANVRHYGHYEQFFSANVSTVQNLIDFCTAVRKKDFVQTSTVSVGMGNIEGVPYQVFTEDDLDIGQISDNYYVKTKLEAERITVAARKNGINTTIFRLGNICLSSDTLKLQANIEENAFYMVLEGFVNISRITQSYAQAELSFVDQCSDAICRLMICKDLKNTTYHIQNHHIANVAEMLTERDDLALHCVTDQEFKKFLSGNVNREDLAHYIENLLTHIDGLNDDGITVTEVLTQKTKYALEKLEFTWKKPTQDMLMALVRKALAERVVFAKSLPCFAAQSDEELYALAGIMQSQCYCEGEYIRHEHKKYDNLLILRSGMGDMFMTTKSGWEGELEIIKKGEVIGIESFIGEQSGITLESVFGDVTTFSIDKKHMDWLCRKYPGFAKSLLKFTNEKLQKIRSLWANVN